MSSYRGLLHSLNLRKRRQKCCHTMLGYCDRGIDAAGYDPNIARLRASVGGVNRVGSAKARNDDQLEEGVKPEVDGGIYSGQRGTSGSHEETGTDTLSTGDTEDAEQNGNGIGL